MSPEGKKKKVRVTTGCLCCRKRKIKCDETKPSCNNCEKSLYHCEWSKGKESLESIARFVLRKKKPRNNKFIDVSDSFRVFAVEKSKNRFKPSKQKEPKTMTAIAANEAGPLAVSTRVQHAEEERSMQLLDESKREFDVDADALFRKYLELLGSRYILSLKSQNLLNVTEEESHFFDAFINGFLVSISPQLAHENLQLSTIVIPRCVNNETLKKVFLTCGATFLSWNNKEFRSFAELQYQDCMVSIQNFLDSDDYIRGSEDWILITMITLCLREKYQCKNRIRNAIFLIASFKIICFWARIKSKNNYQIIESEESCDGDDAYGNALFDYLDQLKLKSDLSEIFACLSSDQLDTFSFKSLTVIDEPQYTARDKWLSTDNDLVSALSNVQYSISAFERTMIESFLYNYCVNLLNIDLNLVKFVESPFRVFEVVKPFLTQPIYKCPVSWMNNPIMGASLSAFELVAKSNWLRLKFPLDANSAVVAEHLRKIARYYTPTFLPKEARFNQPLHIQTKLLESCYIGVMAAKASYILLTKILYPAAKADSPDIQEELDIFFRNFEKIGLYSLVSGVCLWQVVIAGLAVIKDHQRQYLLYRIRIFGEMKKSQAMLRVTEFLQFHWANSTSPEDTWQVLLDLNGFKDLFI